MPIPSVTTNPAPSSTQAPATPSNQSADAGMTFDASPVSVATTVPASAPAPSSNRGADAGMTFDAAPVTKALPVPAQTQQSQPAQSSYATETFPTGTVSAVPNSTTADHLKNWATAVSNDLRNGTQTTTLGALLHKLGAPGLNSGVAPLGATPLLSPGAPSL